MALFGSKSSPQPTVPSEVTVDLAEEGLARIRLSGDVDGLLIKKATDQLRALVKGKRVRVVFIDGMPISKMEASMRGPTADLLGVMKTAGVTRVVIATSSSVVRLIATTLGLASGLKVELFETTELAMRRVHAALKGNGKDA
jgi:hypothetical protein